MPTEIAKLSRQIDENTRYFEAILSSISDFAYTFNREGRFVFINQALLDLWGLKLEEAVGKNFFELQYPDDLAARLQQQIEQVFETRQSVTDETPYTSPTGESGYYEYIFNPFFGADGSVELVVGTTRNITERKQTEKVIIELGARNREILESITDAFFAIDENWRFTYVNKQAEEMLNQKRGDLIGQILWEIYPGLNGTEFEKVYRQAARDQVAATIMGFYPDHDRWYDVNIFPAQNGITIYFKDVSARVQADEALRKSRDEAERQHRLYETILSNTPDFAYVFSLDRRFLYANDILLEMWGKTREEAIGKTFFEIGYEPWHAEMHEREIDEVVATKAPIRGEVPFTGTFGRRIYDYIFVPVFGTDGEVEAVAGTTRDITDRQEMEEALREGDRRKDEFLATLAHELRNPLAPIRSGIEVLRRSGMESTQVSETLDVIERQANQMVHLVDDLLDISRITQGKINLKKERIDLKEAIGISLESSRGLIDKAQNELTVSFPPEPIFLDADLTRIAQIFLNILHNAAKYSDPGGRITLLAGRENGNAIVDIIDTGLGIEPAMLPTIFDMFGQIASPDDEARGGLGIGLSVVKKLVEMHGGSVQAQSEGLGKGSIFTVRLPLAEVQSPELAADRSALVPGETAELREQSSRDTSTPPASASRRVLVVDDNLDGLEMLTTLLSLEGHSVRQAADGLSAIETAREFGPEICLCDIGLPGMNGYDLAVHLREMLPGALLMSISGWGREEDRQRSRTSGFDFHLVKPVQFDEILEIIRTASQK